MKRRDFLRKSLLAATGSMILGGGIMKAVENLNTKNSSRMKIVVLTGSPRRNGNSAYLAEQFIKGAQEKVYKQEHDEYEAVYNCIGFVAGRTHAGKGTEQRNNEQNRNVQGKLSYPFRR